MKIVEKLFDHYVINARIRVALFVSFPLVVTLLVWIPHSKGWGATLLTLLVTFGIFAFFSNAISNRGQKLEIKLFEQWGGAPTTYLLRHKDKTIDPYTKKRIHHWLESHINGLNMPSVSEEVDDPDDADYLYKSAVHYLRENTRDRTKYKIVYSDLVAYGFARNTLALKSIALVLAVGVLILNVFLLPFRFSGFQDLNNRIAELDLLSIGYCVPGLVSIIFVVVFGFFITPEHVRQRAERYAKSLLAVCDKVSE